MALVNPTIGVYAAGAYSAIATPRVNNIDGSPYLFGVTMDGWVVGWAAMDEYLSKTDKFGKATVESFSQGFRCSISAIFHEWNTIEVTAITPGLVIGATGVNYWGNGIPGQLGTANGFALTMTATPDTPAEANGPASITFPYVRLRSDYDVGMLFGPEHRVVPFQGIVFPYYDVLAINAGQTVYAVTG